MNFRNFTNINLWLNDRSIFLFKERVRSIPTFFKSIQFIFLVIAVGIFPSCSKNPATGKPSFTGFMSEAHEARVGAEEHPKLVKRFGGEYKNKALAEYVKNIGNKIVAASGIFGINFRFLVLNHSTVNAFALPGGYVYITRGLVALAEDEAELAGVIAHEIGHIVARHTAERYSQAVAANVGLTTLDIIGPLVGVPARLSPFFSFGTEAALRAYSRSQELEADMLGARYMREANYDPAALIDFFTKLEGEKKLRDMSNKRSRNLNVLNSILATHPRTKDRIKEAANLNRGSFRLKRERKRDSFLIHMDGLIFGHGPRDGFMKDNSFIHPFLGFRFEIPDGFWVENLPDRVIAKNAHGAIMLFTLKRVPKALRKQDLKMFLLKGQNTPLAFSQVERLNIKGLEAITGSHLVSMGKLGKQYVRRVVMRDAGAMIYKFDFFTPAKFDKSLDEMFKKTVFSFRLLSPSQATQIKPNQIKVVRVGTNDSIDGLASRMPFGNLNQHWFQLLNSNVISDGLMPGERVKLVTD